jgi:hypothetical protein
MGGNDASAGSDAAAAAYGEVRMSLLFVGVQYCRS